MAKVEENVHVVVVLEGVHFVAWDGRPQTVTRGPLEARRADEVVAGAMKTGLRNNRTGISLTDAQVACLNAVPHSQFSDVVTKALAEGLTNEEVMAAITFYRTPAGPTT